MKTNLLKELADIDHIIEKLEARRADIINMLDVIETLSRLGPEAAPLSDNNLPREKVVSISVKSYSDGLK